MTLHVEMDRPRWGTMNLWSTSVASGLLRLTTVA